MCPNKTGSANLNVFNLITRIDESKTLTNHIFYKYRYKFDGKKVIQIKSRTTMNVDVSAKIRKKHHMCGKKNWYFSICNCKNRKYFIIIIGDSAIMLDEIIEVTKTIPKRIILTKTFQQKLF